MMVFLFEVVVILVCSLDNVEMSQESLAHLGFEIWILWNWWIHFRLIKYQGPHLENVADMAHPSKNLKLTRNYWMEMKVQDFYLRELIKMGRETPSSSTLAPWNFVTFGNRCCWKELWHDHGVKWNKYSLHPFWHLGISAKSDSFPRLPLNHPCCRVLQQECPYLAPELCLDIWASDVSVLAWHRGGCLEEKGRQHEGTIGVKTS